MSKDKIQDWDATAASNTDVGGINIAENCAAANINNAIREAMSQVKEHVGDTEGGLTSAGSANAYTITTNATWTAYANGYLLAFKANHSNTGAATLNVDSIGAKDIKVYTPSGVGDPAAGDIQSAGVYLVVYISTIDDFVLLNPAGIPSTLVDDTTPQLGGDLDTNAHAVFESKGADVASATELLVLTDGNFFDVTGTTTITSIEETADAFGVGSEIQLQFDGALTLTHNASDLILPGGANITTAAGDVATLRKYAAGDWVCVDYTKATGFPVRGGKVVQMVSTTTSAVATGTTTIPHDDTIPQNTEGDEYMTLAITPESASSTLRIDVTAVVNHTDGDESITHALFVDSTASAIAAVSDSGSKDDDPVTTTFSVIVSAGSTSARTYKYRCGCELAGTTTFNGIAGVRLYGGVAASSIVITEYQ